MLTLYQFGNSVCAQKVRITLAEKDLDWEPVEVNLFKSEQYNPEYLKLNPKVAFTLQQQLLPYCQKLKKSTSTSNPMKSEKISTAHLALEGRASTPLILRFASLTYPLASWFSAKMKNLKSKMPIKPCAYYAQDFTIT